MTALTLSHCRAVAMHRAFSACGPLFAETAMLEALVSVGQQFLAFVAEDPLWGLMLLLAEQVNHLSDA